MIQDRKHQKDDRIASGRMGRINGKNKQHIEFVVSESLCLKDCLCIPSKTIRLNDRKNNLPMATTLNKNQSASCFFDN